MRSFWKFNLAMAASLLLAVGCGYHFSGEGAGPRPGLKRIAIPVFENETAEPDLGSLFAGALRRQFMQRGGMVVVPSEQAEAVFKGRVIGLHASAVSHREVEQTIETRLYATLEIRCVDAKNGAVLWQDPKLIYYKVFTQATDPMASFDNRRQALAYLAEEMAIRIHDRFLSNF
jgi:outer membrane lipopolysaccharide assembly protein LptE/RlpB